MGIGEFNIHVKAAVRDSSLSDGIVKKLLVVVSGGAVFGKLFFLCVCVRVRACMLACFLSHRETVVLKV